MFQQIFVLILIIFAGSCRLEFAGLKQNIPNVPLPLPQRSSAHRQLFKGEMEKLTERLIHGASKLLKSATYLRQDQTCPNVAGAENLLKVGPEPILKQLANGPRNSKDRQISDENLSLIKKILAQLNEQLLPALISLASAQPNVSCIKGFSKQFAANLTDVKTGVSTHIHNGASIGVVQTLGTMIQQLKDIEAGRKPRVRSTLNQWFDTLKSMFA